MGTPAAAARSTASRTRSSASRRGPAYSAAAGTPARSASSTAFRPATTSAASPAPRARPAASARGRASPLRTVVFAAERRPLPGLAPAPAGFRGPSPGSGRPARLVPPRAAASARRCAGCPGRRCAGGVGPLPSSLSRPLPPVPARGLPDLVRPPRLPVFPLMPWPGSSGGYGVPVRESSLDLPTGTVRGVFDEDPRGVQAVPDRVRRLVVLAVLGRLPLVERHADQRI